MIGSSIVNSPEDTYHFLREVVLSDSQPAWNLRIILPLSSKAEHEEEVVGVILEVEAWERPR